MIYIYMIHFWIFSLDEWYTVLPKKCLRLAYEYSSLEYAAFVN